MLFLKVFTQFMPLTFAWNSNVHLSLTAMGLTGRPGQVGARWSAPKSMGLSGRGAGHVFVAWTLQYRGGRGVLQLQR